MRKKSVLFLMSVLAFGIFTGAGQKSSYGPAAAARESSSGGRPQATQGSNYNTSNSGSGSQYSSGSGSGPGAYYNTNNSGDVSQFGSGSNYNNNYSNSGYPSDENGYIDWSGDYYSGSATYVISGSDREYISADSVAALSDEKLRLAINEIYARHGRKFKSDDLQEYFNGKSWYTPTYEPEEFDKMESSVLNQVEKKNIAVMAAERSRRAK